MLSRSLIVWIVLLAAAFLNATLRELLIVPAWGAGAGRLVSPLTLSAAILLIAWLTIRWIAPASPRGAWVVGAVWVGLTVAFEFLAGHYVFGNPWSRLLEDYDVLRGRIWVLVLLTTAAAPYLTARWRGALIAS